VVGNVATIDAAKTLLQACYPDRSFDIEWRVVDEGDEITMNDWNVTAFNADHTVPVTGYRFEHKDASLAYLPDTCPIKTVLPFISGVSLLLIEAFGTSADFTELARNQKHLLAKDAAQIAQEAQPQKVLLYHMHLPYRDERKQEQLIEEFCQNCSLVPIVAADLLEIGF
jgi:ribonuclease BN (tRNA processing enzyme)